REGDLLLRLEADDVGDLLFFDRRQLHEAGQAALPGDAHGDDVALDRIARQEGLERLTRQLVRVCVGLAEDLRVLDVVEGGRGDGPFDDLKTQRLQGALADVDAPHTLRNGHE